LPKAPYYIIITRRNQVLLSFLDIRVVVNNKEIYPLLNTEPIVIPVEKDNPKIVVTDGFHYTKPLELSFRQPAYFNFDVVCAIDDLQLLAASLILAILYMLGFITGFFILKLLSFTPIIWVLVYYYFNRKNFIRIVKAGK
jgi:hypothetical protein